MNLDFLNKEIKKEKVNCCLIYQNQDLQYSYYKNNKQRDKLHKLNSCTKSILSILIAIAIDKGYIPSIHTPIRFYFPKVLSSQADPRKKELTIRHLLTMSDGLDFPELGEWNSFAPMVYHHDIIKFVLDRPLIHEPGTHMNYNSGCSHILSGILQLSAGMKTEEFAVKHLFKPLGISEYRWYEDRMKINKGADGLVLKAEDMIKIGCLMLQKGLYSGKRVVSEEWLLESIKPNLLTYEFIGHHGMHWWVNKLEPLNDFSPKNSFYFALGFGGQYIIVLPSLQMVIVITGELYHDSLKPMRIIREKLFPVLKENLPS
ncbi:serine hydrolase domain-containing protein [Peribacillus kribbensis]|uniref:serine hydrolase domain-containing protein n=1 Tax=Peribacillus kribbensis TaxID=356658 RepID=UPI0003FACFF0|nr:serine hydrolase [Peribacillus kribbensis]